MRGRKEFSFINAQLTIKVISGRITSDWHCWSESPRHKQDPPSAHGKKSKQNKLSSNNNNNNKRHKSCVNSILIHTFCMISYV